MFDHCYKESCQEWIEGFLKWQKGKRPDLWTKGEDPEMYWDWSGSPPDIEYYRPDWDEKDMTWYQVYETISEGTPVTPPFATKKELVDYLVENGDFWCQADAKLGRSYPCKKPTREQAQGMVDTGWAMSGIITNGKLHGPYEQQDLKVKEAKNDKSS